MRAIEERGFSVSELLVVIAIIGLFAAMLAPSLSNFLPRIQFQSACRQVASDISLQRLRAVERRETTTLQYDAAKRCYELKPYGLKRTLPKEVLSVTLPTLSFNSRGLMPSGAETTITLTGKNNRQCTIKVSPAGRIQINQTM